MRHAFFVVTAAVLLTPPPAPAADLPPIVIQIAPPGKVLDDVRGMAKAMGGDKAVAAFNDYLKTNLGDGLTAVDLNRPVVFGVYIRPNAPKDKDAYGFGLIFINDEKGFVELLKKSDENVEPIAGKKGLYKCTSKKKKEGDEPSYVQVSDGRAVLGFGITEAEFDPSKYPAYEKLAIPAETAPLAVRVYFDRFPAEVQKQMSDTLDKGIAQLDNIPVPAEAKEGIKKATRKLGASAKRLLMLAKETTEVIVRLTYDPASAETALEAGVVGKPGSALAKLISGLKPTTNLFGALIGEQTVGGLKLSLPLGDDDSREGLALAIESGGKEGLAGAPPIGKPALEELIKGFARTVRSGELDAAAALNGPDKDGRFMVLVGLSFDDPAALEKQLRKLFENEAPPPIKDLVKLDADKANGVNIHLAKIGAFLPAKPKQTFGEESAIAFAFAPKGIYVAFGTNPIPALKAALAARPEAARALDVSVNTKRLEQVISSYGGEADAARVAKFLGADDKLLSALFVSVQGGSELKIRIGMNMKLLPHAGFETSSSKAGAP